jgi:hypothetical protein
MNKTRNMPGALAKLDGFHRTRVGYVVFGLLELAMAYGFLNWAFDTGNLLWWVCASVLGVGFLQNMVRAVVGVKK